MDGNREEGVRVALPVLVVGVPKSLQPVDTRSELLAKVVHYLIARPAERGSIRAESEGGSEDCDLWNLVSAKLSVEIPTP